MKILTIINDAGIIGYIIVSLGLVSLGILIERSYTLFFKFNFNTAAFIIQIETFVRSHKFNEAISTCHHLASKPLAKAFKTIIERSDKGDEFIFQAHDIAQAESLPLFSKRLGYLAMFSNVATLLGLLGTIQGLIMAFDAVSKADPSQKQILLAQGISLAMYDTALGLVVAIPTMIAYSVLNAKQVQMSEQFVESTSKLVEQLTSSHLSSLEAQSIFPTHLSLNEFESQKFETVRRVQ